MKGIILAAGRGTRLYPMTKPICKPLLPVYDKPMIYYPLTVLIQAGIKDILIIIPPGTEDSFFALLGDGKQLGLHIEYKVQTVARGIADAFIIGEDFINNSSVCLVLGDNIFWHKDLCSILNVAMRQKKGATVFGYWVKDPRPFGVVEFNEQGRAVSIEEKPLHPKSNYIIPGLYFYDNQVVEISKNLKPSARGELEITDVNLQYLQQGQLQVIPFDKDFLWKDTGTAETLLDAAQMIREYQERGIYLGCIEEIARKRNFINDKEFYNLANSLSMSAYGQYLLKLTKEIKI